MIIDNNGCSVRRAAASEQQPRALQNAQDERTQLRHAGIRGTPRRHKSPKLPRRRGGTRGFQLMWRDSIRSEKYTAVAACQGWRFAWLFKQQKNYLTFCIGTSLLVRPLCLDEFHRQLADPTCHYKTSSGHS